MSWKTGDQAWYVGDVKLGDDEIERQTVTSISDGDYLHFDGMKRVVWISADVAYCTHAEAKRALDKQQLLTCDDCGASHPGKPGDRCPELGPCPENGRHTGYLQ